MVVVLKEGRIGAFKGVDSASSSRGIRAMVGGRETMVLGSNGGIPILLCSKFNVQPHS